MSRSRLARVTGSGDRRTLLALVAVAIAGLAVRLADLGGRVMHWDEGRVGYWTLRYAETGEFAYEPIIHGPFLRIVNAAVFGVLPPTDASARLVVAVVGGLLPLAAWLFREHLDRVEIVAFAALLAANPLLVYYSRFMRNDVLVGGFALVALGFAVRAIDTRRPIYCYPGAVFLALSVSTKANTLLYVLCFLGAATLVADHALVRRTRDAESVADVLRSWLRAGREVAREAAGIRSPWVALPAHALGVGVTFLAVVVFFYAPRPMLHEAFANPSLWSTVVHESTVGSARELVDLWIAGDMQQGNPYLEFLRHELTTLAYGAAVVCVLAVVGFVVDGYVRPAGERKPAEADDSGTDASAVADGGREDDEAKPGADGEAKPGGNGEVEAETGEDDVTGTPPSVPAGRNRALVAFATYWALASLIGYPIATDINAPWSAVHIVLPLTIPAAVGLAYLAREARRASALADRRTATLAVVVLLVATAGVMVPTATYWNSANPDHTAMVQWAQPQNDLRESLDDAEAVITAGTDDDRADGVDVLFVGSDGDGDGRENTFYVANEAGAETKPGPTGWYDRLPLPWYFERAGATVDSVPSDADRVEALADPPPVVVIHAENREEVDPHLKDHVSREHQLRLWGYPVVIYVDEDALAAAGRR